MEIVKIKLPHTMQLEDQLLEFASINPELKFEIDADGELTIVSPTGGNTGRRNSRIIAELQMWNDELSSGIVFDSSTMFILPNGAKRSPDVSWILLDRWNALTVEQQDRFPPLCPDFVVELQSPSDSLKMTQKKMDEYKEQGIKLGWLIDPESKTVTIYRQKSPLEVLQSPTVLVGEDVLPGFNLALNQILY